MEIYKYNELKNGDILLEKVILDIKKYQIIDEKNGNKIFRKIKKIKSIEELENYNFAYSKIISVFLNNEVIEINKYKKLLEKIYYTIGDGCKIIKNTTIAIKTIKKTIEGYTFLKELGISVQGIDSNKCIK
jgi:hypothetical protein